MLPLAIFVLSSLLYSGVTRLGALHFVEVLSSAPDWADWTVAHLVSGALVFSISGFLGLAGYVGLSLAVG